MERLSYADAKGDTSQPGTPAASTSDLEPSYMFQQAAQITQYVRANGRLPDWFSPGTPMPPIAPAILAGRQFDFPSAFNTNASPKFGEGIPYTTLRTFSRVYDLQRMVIEKCKDRICRLEWNIVPKDSKKKPDARCDMLNEFFLSPDKEHTWAAWLRMLLEDLYVLDAPTLYPRKARDGSLYALEPMDGATIKRVLDDFGRTPMPPYPAYQQKLKGVAALNYTREELLWSPRNPSTDRVYGYSPVEQVIITVNIALRRQAHQLQYYTDGSTPDLILSLPADWTVDQLKAFEEYWNSKLLGNTAARRGTKFVFDGTTTVDTKAAALVDKMDEWLARVICFCFGVSSQPFVAQVNRSVAESAAEQAKEDGDGPIMDWVRDMVDICIARFFGMGDLCFKWKEQDETSPEIKAKIADMRLRNASLCINEYRASEGDDPIEGGDVYLIYTGAGIMPLERALDPPLPPPGSTPPDGDPNAVDAAAADENGKGKGGSSTKSDDTDTADADTVEKAAPRHLILKNTLGAMFANVIHSIAAQVDTYLSKDDAEDETLLRILQVLDFSAFGKAEGVVRAVLEGAAAKGGADGLFEIGVKAGDDLFDLIPDVAADIAGQRAGELIASDASGGELGDSTRLLVRGTIQQALAEGWDIDELTDALRSSYAFSEDRAEVIADYEMRNAINQGELQTWKASGVVTGKEWLLSNDDGICDICNANAAQGQVGIEDSFSSGDDAPPAHPNCRCSLSPVVTTDDADNG